MKKLAYAAVVAALVAVALAPAAFASGTDTAKFWVANGPGPTNGSAGTNVAMTRIP
jgi:hypothetical protein